jgi:iron(III) transport system substrate-binding protein
MVLNQLEGMMNRFTGLAFGLAGVLLAAPAAEAATQALIDAAKKEGEVTWYTTLIVNQTAKPMTDAFEKKYGIKVNYIRANSTDIILRILTEAKAGKVQADIFDGTSGPPQLKRANLLEKWLPDIAAEMPASYHDPDGYWMATSLYIETQAYNTNLVKPADAPQTLEDLLDPKWKGKLAMGQSSSAPGVGGFIGFVMKTMGEQKGVDYLKKLGQQDVHILQVSARQVLDQVIAGEYPIGVQMLNHHVAFSRARGAPVGWVQTKPAAMAAMLVLGLVKGPHRNAGKLLIDFIMSDDGQKIFRDADYIPVAPNVPPKDPALRPDGDKFKAVFFTPEEMDKGVKHWMALYQQYLR